MHREVLTRLNTVNTPAQAQYLWEFSKKQHITIFPTTRTKLCYRWIPMPTMLHIVIEEDAGTKETCASEQLEEPDQANSDTVSH